MYESLIGLGSISHAVPELSFRYEYQRRRNTHKTRVSHMAALMSRNMGAGIYLNEKPNHNEGRPLVNLATSTAFMVSEQRMACIIP